MPTSLTNFVNGAVVAAADLRSRLDEVQDYINGGVIAGDLKTSAKWVDPAMIDPPRFFVGQRASRAVMASCDLHWVRTGQSHLVAAHFSDDASSGRWTTIPGMATSIYVNPPRSGATATIYVNYTLYSAESGATSGAGGTEETNEACQFRLFVNETGYPVTDRRLYASTQTAEYYFARKNATVSKVVAGVASGENKISVRIKVNDNAATGTRAWNHIFARSRFLRVRVQYL